MLVKGLAGLNVWVLILLTLLVASCRSKDGDFTFFSEDKDLALGLQMDQQIKADQDQFPILDRNQYQSAYTKLEDITAAILKSPDILYRDEFKWQVHLIDNDTIYNAFCTPGGYIYVYTGLIKFLDKEDELAGVLGHEIAHADLRHSIDQMTKSYGLRILIYFITGGHGDFLANIGLNLLDLSFSRSDEKEADEQSVIYLNATDYDPRGFANFFKKLSEKGESLGALQFISTHPNPENRVEDIEIKWRELGSKMGKDFSTHFKELKNSLPSSN